MKLGALAFALAMAACSGAHPDAPAQAHDPAVGQIAPVAPGRESRTHEPSPPEEAAKNREGCDRGDAAACHAAALDQYYSPPSPDSDRLAREYFEKGCNAGYAPSCNGLGVLYATGRGVPQDEAEAVRIYRKACVDGATTACTHLEQALRYGRGAPKDLDAADAAAARGKCVFEASLKHASVASCPSLAAADGGTE